MRTANILLTLMLAYSCSKSGFQGESTSSTPAEQPETVTELPPEVADAEPVVPEVVLETAEGGLVGGHFDLDTSSQIYPFNQGETDGHVHEYDDKYMLNGADFFDLKSDKLMNIQNLVPAGKEFLIHVVNGALSPAGVLEINGKLQLVQAYQADPNHLKTKYTIDQAANLLQSMSIRFQKNALINKGLIGTETGCVRSNEPGKNNEYRNGALLVQILDANNYTLDPNYGFATTGLIWEASIFWHHDEGCYK